jgi:hypothetical protein
LIDADKLHRQTVQLVNRTPPMTWRQFEALFLRWDLQLAAKGSWRIAGRPVISILNLSDFVKHYGPTLFIAMLDRARTVMTTRTGVEPFMLGVIGRADAANAMLARRLPLDGITGYALLPNWLKEPIQDYGALIHQRVAEWYRFQRVIDVPFFPVVAAGWDASIRGARVPTLDSRLGFPWVPIVTGVTPQLFGMFLDAALRFNREMHPELNIVFLHAWNEWTESSVIEPSDRFGHGFLDEIRRRSL